MACRGSGRRAGIGGGCRDRGTLICTRVWCCSLVFCFSPGACDAKPVLAGCGGWVVWRVLARQIMADRDPSIYLQTPHAHIDRWFVQANLPAARDTPLLGFADAGVGLGLGWLVAWWCSSRPLPVGDIARNCLDYLNFVWQTGAVAWPCVLRGWAAQGQP